MINSFSFEKTKKKKLFYFLIYSLLDQFYSLRAVFPIRCSKHCLCRWSFFTLLLRVCHGLRLFPQ